VLEFRHFITKTWADWYRSKIIRLAMVELRFAGGKTIRGRRSLCEIEDYDSKAAAKMLYDSLHWQSLDRRDAERPIHYCPEEN
jgi:hypothetical protein